MITGGQLWYILYSELLYFVTVTWPAIVTGFVVALILQAVYIMIDTRANPYKYILAEHEQIVAHFHVTQQIGFKPVLHCSCGGTMDLNLRGNGRHALAAFKRSHEACNAQEVA